MGVSPSRHPRLLYSLSWWSDGRIDGSTPSLIITIKLWSKYK